MTKFREIRRLLGASGEVNFEKLKELHWNDFVADFNLGVENLDLEDNFKSFRTTVDVNDSDEISILHGLGVVPAGHLVMNGIAGVIRGSKWTTIESFLIVDTDLYLGKVKTVDILILG